MGVVTAVPLWLAVWAVVIVSMVFAFRALGPASAGGALALVVFMAAPVFAMAATIEWRHERQRERMHTRPLRRGAY